MDGEEPMLLSLSPYVSSSSLLKDISNFKTPKHSSQNPNFHSPCTQFFTASKQTPRPGSSLHRNRPSLAPASSSARSKTTARRLRAFEVEHSKSARKAQIKKEQSLKSLANSLTVWLTFLFENPNSCGCDLAIADGRGADRAAGKGKRDNSLGFGVCVDATWQNPKRQRDSLWRPAEENVDEFPNSMFASLRCEESNAQIRNT